MIEKIGDYLLLNSKSNLWIMASIVFALSYQYISWWAFLWYFLSAFPITVAEVLWENHRIRQALK